MTGGSAQPAPYLRVAAALRQAIAEGTWSQGDRLPSRSELGAVYGGVGDNVVRRAQELLISEGLLEGRAGSGTYVRAPQHRRALLRTPPAGHALLRRPGVAPAGFTGTWEADSTAKVEAPAAIASRLGIEVGARCVRTVYEFLQERQPVMVTTSWEPMELTGGTIVVLPEGGPLAGHGVAARMAHIGITVDRAQEVPRPIELDKEQAHLLGLATGAKATLIERTHLDTSGRAVETADIVVPADRWEITYTLPLAPDPATEA
ncbi:GntR family transcriptional regulator [Streptomyces sp. NPDC048527]|uniref:GntR family transcriptional regulator n=1 Tax=Streptomyces sp. NPDC048527 TaxID=3365568 RepID=UPI00371487CF